MMHYFVNETPIHVVQDDGLPHGKTPLTRLEKAKQDRKDIGSIAPKGLAPGVSEGVSHS